MGQSPSVPGLLRSSSEKRAMMAFNASRDWRYCSIGSSITRLLLTDGTCCDSPQHTIYALLADRLANAQPMKPNSPIALLYTQDLRLYYGILASTGAKENTRQGNERNSPQ